MRINDKDAYPGLMALRNPSMVQRTSHSLARSAIPWLNLLLLKLGDMDDVHVILAGQGSPLHSFSVTSSAPSTPNPKRNKNTHYYLFRARRRAFAANTGVEEFYLSAFKEPPHDLDEIASSRLFSPAEINGALREPEVRISGRRQGFPMNFEKRNHQCIGERNAADTP